MIIKRKALSDLNPSEYNPRRTLTAEDKDFERLVSSIQTFGNVEPIVWNEVTGNIIGGHQRYAVLQHLGETETDVVVVSLPIEEERLLNIALNKIQGKWNYDKLSATLQQFDPVDAKLTGFSAQEIMLLVAEANDQVNEALRSSGVGSSPVETAGGSEGEEGDRFMEAGDQDDDSDDIYEGTYEAAPSTVGTDGVSWAVCLKFPNLEAAKTWMEANGIHKKINKGWTTIVVRMGEDDIND